MRQRLTIAHEARGARGKKRLDAIERAIRSALERGDADDRGFREKVYRSVFAALERNIAASSGLTEEVAQRRRLALKARITEIEQEFQPALRAAGREPAPPPISATDQPAAPMSGPEVRGPLDLGGPEFEAPVPSLDEPARGAHRFGHSAPDFPDIGPADGSPGFAPDADLAATPAADERLYDREAASERRRPWAAMLIAATVLAALAIGGWMAVSMGLLGRPDGSVPNPPVETAAEDFEPEPAPPLGPATAETTRDWITAFSPADPVAVTAPAGARADIMEEEGQPFIRIRSGAAGEPVVFDVGQGILERLAGRSAVFDIVGRAEEGQETQISVQCDFGGLGDCGRRRYLVGTHRGDYLFEVELPSGSPRGAGTISIVSDVDNGGKAVDIFEIRASVTE
jgi:hypothetical protein